MLPCFRVVIARVERWERGIDVMSQKGVVVKGRPLSMLLVVNKEEPNEEIKEMYL